MIAAVEVLKKLNVAEDIKGAPTHTLIATLQVQYNYGNNSL